MAARLSYLYPAWEGDVVVHVDLRHHTLAVGEYLVYRLHSFAVFLTIRRLTACMVLIALRALRLFEARCDNNLYCSSLIALRALRLFEARCDNNLYCSSLIALCALRLFEARCDNNLYYSSLVALLRCASSRRGVTIICIIHR